MKNVIIYSRVSTDEQAQQGYSLEYQEETIKRFCDFRSYKVVECFREDCSGKDFERPSWKKIESIIKSRKGKIDSIDSVVILRHDRFARNLILSFLEKTKFLKLGCEIEFVEGQIDDTNPEALLLQAISYALPEIENKKISKRSKEGSHKARLNGCHTGIAPKGYDNARLGKDSTLSFNKDSEYVREAFEKMASGIYSADEVRRWLNLKGVKLCKNTFLNMIRNITYTGKIHVKPFLDEPEQIVIGLHPPLISEEVFAAANKTLNGRKKNMKFHDDKSDLYPLKGHLICPIHGRTLSAYGSKGRSQIYHYYVCTKNKCPRYPIDWAHNEIERILATIEFSAQTIKSYKSVLEKIFATEDVERKNTLSRLETEIKKFQTQKQFIQGQYMDGLLPSIEYQELKISIDEKLFESERSFKELNEVSTPYYEYLKNHVPMFEDLVSFYKKVDGKTKKKILSCIFSKKLFFEDGKAAAPSFTPPIEILINASKVLEKKKKEKEVVSDLLFTLAPLFDRSCNYNAMIECLSVRKSKG
jgi:DNA invertase Pin-like site-specific DNA recombinase